MFKRAFTTFRQSFTRRYASKSNLNALTFKFKNNFNYFYPSITTLTALSIFGAKKKGSENSDEKPSNNEASSKHIKREAHPQWQAGQTKIHSLKTYTRDEVKKHNTEDDIWITYYNGVYDITNFLDEHPGNRSRILLATNGNHDISTFWKQLGQHNQKYVHQMLEKYRVGNLDNSDIIVTDVLTPPIDPGLESDRKDLYNYAFSYSPFIAETPVHILDKHWHTPINYHYVRNHYPTPIHLDDNDEFSIEGIGIPDIKYKENNDLGHENGKIYMSYKELKKLDTIKADIYLQCGGHRRIEYKQFGKVKGSNWNIGAVSNGEYEGVLLRDLLKHHNIDVDSLISQDLHVWFLGADVDPMGQSYGVSIPIGKALSVNGEVMLAYEYNGSPLTYDHGYPCRIVVPGWVGSRSVKWIERIIISDKECDYSTYTKSYRMTSDNVNEIRDLPVNSSIHYPQNNSNIPLLKDNTIEIRGEAHSGDGRSIIRVDVSIDNGNKWYAAELYNPKDMSYGKVYAWTKWKINIPYQKKDGNNQLSIVCRAFDSSHNRQPQSCKNDIVFNPKGYTANSYHKVNVNVV